MSSTRPLSFSFFGTSIMEHLEAYSPRLHAPYDLPEVGQALHGVRLPPRSSERRQQDRDQQGDDADDNQEFDERETAIFSHWGLQIGII